MTWYNNYLKKIAHNLLSDDPTNPGKKVWQTMYDNYFDTELPAARNLAAHFDNKSIFNLFVQQLPNDLKNNNEFKNELKEYSESTYQFNPYENEAETTNTEIEKIPDELFIYIKTFIKNHLIINQRQNPYSNPNDTIREAIVELYENLYTVPDYQLYFKNKWNKVKQFILNNYDINIDDLNINKESVLEPFEFDYDESNIKNSAEGYEGEDPDDIEFNEDDFDDSTIEPNNRRNNNN
jgi:hypothetical protein